MTAAQRARSETLNESSSLALTRASSRSFSLAVFADFRGNDIGGVQRYEKVPKNFRRTSFSGSHAGIAYYLLQPFTAFFPELSLTRRADDTRDWAE